MRRKNYLDRFNHFLFEEEQKPQQQGNQVETQQIETQQTQNTPVGTTPAQNVQQEKKGFLATIKDIWDSVTSTLDNAARKSYEKAKAIATSPEFIGGSSGAAISLATWAALRAYLQKKYKEAKSKKERDEILEKIRKINLIMAGVGAAATAGGALGGWWWSRRGQNENKQEENTD